MYDHPQLIFDMDRDDYDALPCMNGSTLSAGLDCPLALQKAIAGRRKPPTADMIQGVVAHSMILDPPAEQARTFAVAPPTMIDDKGEEKPTRRNTKAWNAWSAEQRPGVYLMKHNEVDDARRWSDAVLNHDGAMAILANTRSEATLVWNHSTGRWCKGRIDSLHNDQPLVGDLKFSVSAKPSKFLRQAYDLGYPMKMAMYLHGLSRAMDVDIADVEHVYIVVEKERGIVQLMELESDAIEIGLREYDDLMIDLATYDLWPDIAPWPAYVDGVAALAVPGWRRNQYEAIR